MSELHNQNPDNNPSTQPDYNELLDVAEHKKLLSEE